MKPGQDSKLPQSEMPASRNYTAEHVWPNFAQRPGLWVGAELEGPVNLIIELECQISGTWRAHFVGHWWLWVNSC